MEGVETTEGWLQLKVQSVRAAQGCSALPEALSAERSCGAVVVSCVLLQNAVLKVQQWTFLTLWLFCTTQLCPSCC